MDTRFVVVFLFVVAFSCESSSWLFGNRQPVNPLKTCKKPGPLEVCNGSHAYRSGGCSDREKHIDDVLAKSRRNRQVAVVALMDGNCYQPFMYQAPVLRELKKSLIKERVEASVMIIDKAWRTPRKEFVARAGGVPIYKSTVAFTTLGGQRDEVFIFDCVGRLRYHMKSPATYQQHLIRANVKQAAQDCSRCNNARKIEGRHRSRT